MADRDTPHGHGFFTAVSLLAMLLILAAAFWFAVLPGLSVARQEPSGLETRIATWLLHHSVPAAARDALNPLGVHPDPAALVAGHDRYTAKCETCHGFDGGGRSEIGANVFPHAPVLRAALPRMRDGEIFYHIRNGIRNTAMPAWNFPDAQIWQLVSYLRTLPAIQLRKDQNIAAEQARAVSGAGYVGSRACQSCHQEIYARWARTRMANIVRDPKLHPDAIIPDLSRADPKIVTFKRDDIAFVYGSHWKQRYFKKAGDDYFPLPAQWNVDTRTWSKYHVADNQDWWAKFYPDPAGDNSARPTSATCDGCHSVNYNIDTKTPGEWNVGCEECHGAGSAHAAHPTRANILNPARQDFVSANDTCIQCHSQGQPLSNPIKGKYYDWPVGYRAGLVLADYWKLEPHRLGETSFTHYPDGSAHKNRMQGNDFVQSLMYNRGVTCFSCHDPHGSENEAMLRKPVDQICATCHSPGGQNGPRAATLEEHTHHPAASPGSGCAGCHMPKILPELPGGPFVASHTFHFVTPGDTDQLGIPNACNTCHKDKDTRWAAAQLASWKNDSIWRMRR
jgi:predicted CXXCH cytochrome family protein